MRFARREAELAPLGSRHEEGTTMANKQPAVTEQTKTNLRRAFWQLYEQKPIQKITVKQITDLALLANGMLKGKDLSDFIARSEKVVADAYLK